MGRAPEHILYAHVVDLMLDMEAIAAVDPDSISGKQIGNPVMTTGPGIFTKAVKSLLAMHDAYSIDIALESPHMVAHLGIMPRIAVAVGGYGTATAAADYFVSSTYLLAHGNMHHLAVGRWPSGSVLSTSSQVAV